MSYDIDELAIETALVIHVEQITGGARIDCAACPNDAVLHITSEPDMEPGPLCAEHAHQWLNTTMGLLRELFRPENDA